MKRLNFLAATAAALLLIASPASAQLGELLRRVLPPGTPASAPSEPGTPGSLPANVTHDSSSAAIASGESPVRAKKDVSAELAPDRQCNRPQERFNVAEKLVEYGGQEATLRLQRLVQSNYRYDELAPEDQAMLRYIAQTTVWVPPEVELRLGEVSERVSGGRGVTLSELDAEAVKDVDARLDRLRKAVSDFPGRVRLVVNPELPNGAFAKFGGVIQLSPTFLQTMTESPQGGELILAHELSHIYKRHAIKQMQFQLLSTNEGWELGKKLLGRALRGSAVDPLRDGVFVITTVPQLMSFVRGMQSKYSREQELEADACAVVWLTATGADPALSWAEFEKSAGAFAQAPGGYFAVHPPFDERADNFRKKASGKPAARVERGKK